MIEQPSSVVVVPMPPRNINPVLIDMLEHALEGAKTGEFVGMVGLFLCNDRTTVEVFVPHGKDIITICGVVTCLANRVAAIANSGEYGT